MTLSIPPTGETNNKTLSPWELDVKEREEQDLQLEDDSEGEYISEGEIKRPSYRSPWANFALISTGTVGVALTLGYMFFPTFMNSGEKSAPVAQKTTTSTLDNTDQQRAAENQAKLAMGGSEKAFSTHNTQVTPSPTAPPMVAASNPNAKTASKGSPAAKTPTQTVVATPKPTPSAFIQLASSQTRRQPRELRQPLPSESTLFTPKQKPQPVVQPVQQAQVRPPQPVQPIVNATPVGPTLVAGGTASAYLMSALQFPQQARKPIEMRVKINNQLNASNGYALPLGTIVLFSVTCDPANNAISAVSGDAIYNGRRIKMEPGALSINNVNGEPLIAQAYRPGTDQLANADRNNATLSGLAAVGDNLSSNDSTVVTTGGSTVVSTKANQSIYGAFAKGAFGQWSKSQSARTEEESRKLLTAAPIQVLKQQTRMIVTVTSPTTILYQ